MIIFENKQNALVNMTLADIYLFKFNNRNNGKWRRSGAFIVNIFLTYFTPIFSVSNVDFEQVHVRCDIFVTTKFGAVKLSFSVLTPKCRCRIHIIIAS